LLSILIDKVDLAGSLGSSLTLESEGERSWGSGYVPLGVRTRAGSVPAAGRNDVAGARSGLP
jgi:hypothetical protein